MKALLFAASVLIEVALSAAPQFDLVSPWFECSSDQTNGIVCVRSSDDLVFTPTQSRSKDAWIALDVEASFSESDVGSARELVAMADETQCALAVASTDHAALAYFLYANRQWCELTGATPVIGETHRIRFELDYGATPVTLACLVDGERLVERGGAGRCSFALSTLPDRQCNSLMMAATLNPSCVSGACERLDRVVALVSDNEVAGYYSSLGAAISEAKDRNVYVLRPTTFSSASDLPQTLMISSAALRDLTPTLSFTGETNALGEVHAIIALPQDFSGPAPLFANIPDGTDLHLHGVDGAAYVLYPSNDVLYARRDELRLDGGGFVAFVTAPEDSQTFLRGITDQMCGSENALYVNGLGTLHLCGTNAFHGSVFLEAASLSDSGVTKEAQMNLLSAPSQLKVVCSQNANETPQGATGSSCVVLSSWSDEWTGEFSVTFDPGAGRLARLEVENGSLVARIATEPELSASEGFTVSPDEGEGQVRLQTTIRNAVKGFRYGFLASGNLKSAFEPVGERVTAAEDGSLTLTLSEPRCECRYYRLQVEEP